MITKYHLRNLQVPTYVSSTIFVLQAWHVDLLVGWPMIYAGAYRLQYSPSQMNVGL